MNTICDHVLVGVTEFFLLTPVDQAARHELLHILQRMETSESALVMYSE